MRITTDDDFDLARIADSGQCFRWEMTDAHTFRIVAGRNCLYITDLGGGNYDLDCSEDDFGSFWRDYFDLGENYRRIRERIDPGKDLFLWEAAEHEKGIRILRQDPWEMLITFIISQNRNIPAIRRSVALLAEACGEERTDSKGGIFYAFPGPAAVAALTDRELSDCRLGYRCRYVHAAAQAVLSRALDLEELRTADEAEAMKALTGLLGVGKKVASCIALFGLHHTDAFPVDVWVRRILKDQYPEGYPFAGYSPYNGIFQQYMFAYYRHRG